MMMNPVMGWSFCSSRAATETDSFILNWASRRLSASSDPTSMGAISPDWMRAPAGARSPMITPAIVACTPERNMAYQSTDPNTM